jgi:hypothetical protein
MLRKGVFLLAAFVLLCNVVQAGEIKFHEWPYVYIPQEVATIDVVMDVGYWVEIVNQEDKIKLEQEDIHTYQGCLELIVRCNFDLTLSCSITPTGAITGQYSCWFQQWDIDAPGGTATLCASLKNAALGAQPGGIKDVHVASVVISAVPR